MYEAARRFNPRVTILFDGAPSNLQQLRWLAFAFGRALHARAAVVITMLARRTANAGGDMSDDSVFTPLSRSGIYCLPRGAFISVAGAQL